MYCSDIGLDGLHT